MAPIDTDEVDRAVDGVAGEVGEHGCQKARELGLAHLARGKGELAMLDGAEPANVAVDLHVVGRIGEHHLGAVAIKQKRVGRGIHRIATDETVTPDPPDIAGARDGRPQGGSRHGVRRVIVRLGTAKQEVDLGHFEAGDGNVEIEIEARQVLQFDRQDLAIPSGLLGKPIVGEDIGAPLCIIEVLEPQAGYSF